MNDRGCARRCGAGFTLVELLVGMTVSILLVVILFQIFSVSANSWQRGESQVDAYREARAALQMMSRDLGSVSAQFSVNPQASPAPSPTAGGLAPTLVLDQYPNPDPGQQSGDENNEQVYLLTNLPNNGLSSLCAVGYFCQWLPDVNASANSPRAYSLFRQFMGSGQASQPGLFELFKKASQTPLDFLDVFVRSRPNATATANTASATEMASYIWDLQFRIDTNLTAMRGKAQPPSDHGDLLSPPCPIRAYASKTGADHPTGLPAYVEVRFKALSAQGARRLEGNAGVTRDTWWQGTSDIYKTVISRSMQQFVARVPLQAASLPANP